MDIFIDFDRVREWIYFSAHTYLRRFRDCWETRGLFWYREISLFTDWAASIVVQRCGTFGRQASAEYEKYRGKHEKRWRWKCPASFTPDTSALRFGRRRATSKTTMRGAVWIGEGKYRLIDRHCFLRILNTEVYLFLIFSPRAIDWPLQCASAHARMRCRVVLQDDPVCGVHSLLHHFCRLSFERILCTFWRYHS